MGDSVARWKMIHVPVFACTRHLHHNEPCTVSTWAVERGSEVHLSRPRTIITRVSFIPGWPGSGSKKIPCSFYKITLERAALSKSPGMIGPLTMIDGTRLIAYSLGQTARKQSLEQRHKIREQGAMVFESMGRESSFRPFRKYFLAGRMFWKLGFRSDLIASWETCGKLHWERFNESIAKI